MAPADRLKARNGCGLDERAIGLVSPPVCGGFRQAS